jgi:Holliday junction resolvasome RuvABC endonuclease subunit
MALDSSLRRTGVAILEQESAGKPITVLHTDAIAVPASKDATGALLEISDRLDALITTWQPTVAYIESPGKMNKVRSRSIKTVVQLSRASGIAFICLRRAKVPFYEITQSDVKLSLTGWSRSAKTTVASALHTWSAAGNLLGYKQETRGRTNKVDEDKDDAVALGIAGIALDRYKELQEFGR